MFAIEVNFLTGRYVATAHHDRRRAEWPPHPARLFSALVATWADADTPDREERRALEWLESQPSPSIEAQDAIPRSVVTHFVPVNDARIVPRGSYATRARRVDELQAQIEEAKTSGTAKQVASLETKLGSQREVSGIVSRAGKAPVEHAVDILPPGWLSTSGHVRSGQARAYPSVTPTEPRVTYVWPTGTNDNVVRALDSICARVSRLGHSSSLVSCRTVHDYPSPNYVPSDGSQVLRGVRSGQLAALERAFAQHLASKPRNLPFTPVSYRKRRTEQGVQPALEPDTAGEWLVLAFLPRSRTFPSTRAVEVSEALRGAVFRHARDPMPEGLSGHLPSGRPSSNPHVAFLSLPWVGNEHADGRLMGVAVSLPSCLDGESKRAVLKAVGNWENSSDPLTLTLGRRGILKMERIVGPAPLVSLRQGPWSRASRRWASATPIALPTHPGALGSGTASARARAWARAEAGIVRSCRHVGLPEPVSTVVSLSPLLVGARPARSFPAFRQRGQGGSPIARRLVHATVTFERSVTGPLVLGAGRYLGLGLMRPVAEPEKTDA